MAEEAQETDGAPPAGANPVTEALSDASSAIAKGDLKRADDIFQAIAKQFAEQASVFNAMGLVMYSHGRIEDSVAAYKQALEIEPGNHHAANNLGTAFLRLGRLGQAEARFRRITEEAPDYAKGHANLGLALHAQGRPGAAVEALRRAVSIDPAYAKAQFNLGEICQELGALGEATKAFQAALAARPDYAEAYNGLGNVLSAEDRAEAAAEAYEKALEIRPDYPEALNNLGILLRDQGRPAEAEAAYLKALAIRPDLARVNTHLGSVLREQGRADEAIAAFRRALISQPDLADAHFNLSLSLLAEGRFAEGWLEYEWRWKATKFTAEARQFAQPMWMGEALDGKVILIHSEQGFGDAFQFVRYVRDVAERGARVVLECDPQVARLFRGLADVELLRVKGMVLPAFDVHVPLMSLPLLCDTDLSSIPAEIPYLAVDEELIEAWRERTRTDSGAASAPRVGLAWAGRASHPNDRARSIPVEHLLPLLAHTEARFFGLQFDPEADDQELLVEAGLVDFSPFIRDFADTAAGIANLDLVITVDTAVAHLAGAMGKPVWLALPHVAEWRWLKDREDSPWYPTMRLFRQKAPGEWPELIARLGSALGDLIAGKTVKAKPQTKAQTKAKPQAKAKAKAKAKPKRLTARRKKPAVKKK